MVAVSLILLPLLSDQALMALVGRDVFDDRHLYTGIFDAKQPGMYLWYGSISALFGPSQPVAQLFSVAAALLAAFLTVWLLAGRLATAWVKRWAPILVAAAFLLHLNEFEIGQTELLMCVPAAAALLLVVRAGDPATSIWRSMLAGICIGVVAVFKTLLIVVPGVAVGTYVLLAFDQGGRCRHLTAVAAGALLAPAGALVWLLARGDLDAALYAWFAYPAQVLALDSARSTEVLFAAVTRFAVLFAAAGLLVLWRLPTVTRRRDPLDLVLVAWIVAGLAVYAIQVWWSYYLIILLPGLVALAVRQLDDVAARPYRRRRVGMAAVVVLAVPLLVYGSLGTGRMLLDGAGLSAASRDRIAARVGDYDTIRGELAAAGLAAADSLYVLGDPRYQLLADRSIALTTNGWSADLIPPPRWSLLAAELRGTRPDVVFVDPQSADAMRERGAELQAELATRYSVIRHSPLGTWYRARG